ncbi:MAG: carboxypeptidase M32 [Anaerolineae bacterium]|nr:carboxypeptidase M32 [Anaerolineae bacterium]
MESKLKELKAHLAEVYDLNMVGAVLGWDQATYMPPGGAVARGRQAALIGRLAHERFTDPAVGKLLDALQAYGESLPYDSDDAALLRVTRREYERAVKVPSLLLAEMLSHGAETYDIWTRARPANDFSMAQDNLEKTLDLSRRLAECFAPYEHVLDPLINFSDYGMTARSVSAVFAELRAQLVPLVKAISQRQSEDGENAETAMACLRQSFPEDKQAAFGLSIIKEFGYDFERGRQDKTHHPFMTKFSLGDVRITTRFSERDFGDGLFSTAHESGHAMYEQGINRAYEGTPLANGTSAGVHESQSRLWENLVGRSRGFWEHFYPHAQEVFPDQLKPVPLDAFYRAINHVQSSLIRVDADEVTYNLHVMIRFNLERAMLEGALAVKDLPDAWDELYESDLGVAPSDNKDGVLQDVHWYAGTIGGSFQGYTLGNILSGQFYAAALQAHPEIPSEIRQGQFGTLHGWLKENLYTHGSKYTTNELLQRVVGEPLNVQPYMNYLRRKYGELYSL